ncbi:MAG: hypothetical protein FJY92_07310 [Candidatus Hydrogenedentes bacterium]|nr:hypothetical protein [Candidatus Hydrogenedentota bacterium]
MKNQPTTNQQINEPTNQQINKPTNRQTNKQRRHRPPGWGGRRSCGMACTAKAASARRRTRYGPARLSGSAVARPAVAHFGGKPPFIP